MPLVAGRAVVARYSLSARSMVIVKPACDHIDLSIFRQIHEPIGKRDAARPETAQAADERLRFSRADKRIAPALLQQRIDLADDLAIGLLPIHVVVPSVVGKHKDAVSLCGVFVAAFVSVHRSAVRAGPHRGHSTGQWIARAAGHSSTNSADTRSPASR